MQRACKDAEWVQLHARVRTLISNTKFDFRRLSAGRKWAANYTQSSLFLPRILQWSLINTEKTYPETNSPAQFYSRSGLRSKFKECMRRTAVFAFAKHPASSCRLLSIANGEFTLGANLLEDVMQGISNEAAENTYKYLSTTADQIQCIFLYFPASGNILVVNFIIFYMKLYYK